MARRLTILLAALLVLGFAIAGCGDDEKDSNAGTTTEEVVTDTDTVTDDETATEDDTVTDDVTDTVTEETETQDSGGATPPSNDRSGAAKAPTVAECKKSIGRTPQISDDLKDAIADLCEKGPDASTEEREEVCKQFAEEVVPEGPARDQTIEQCEKNVE